MNNNENINNQVNESNVEQEVNNQVNDSLQLVTNNNSIDINQPIVNDNPTPLGEKTKNNNILIIILLLIIVGIGGYFAYTNFIAKKEPKGNDNPTPFITPEPSNNLQPSSANNEITELTPYFLKNNKTIELQLNNNTIKIKNTNGKLYYNDQLLFQCGKCSDEDYENFIDNCSTLYKTNKFILITTEYQHIEYLYIINENGKLVEVDETTPDTGAEGISQLRLENGLLIGTLISNDIVPDQKVEFVYEVDKMTIKYAE